MTRPPWWSLPLAFAAGLAAALLWPSGSDAALDELRASVTDAEERADSIARVADDARERNDSLLTEHEAQATESDSTIARLTRRIESSTARASDVATEIRARVDAETAGLVDEMAAEWQAALEAERAQKEEWRERALSAEAGWRDARLVIRAKDDEIRALTEAHEAQTSVNRALESENAKLRRDMWISRAAGLGGVVWGLAR